MKADEQIKLIRQSLNVTQQELAKRLKVPASTISNIENGSREIPKSLMKQMVEELGLDATWVLTGKGEMFASQKKEVSSGQQRIPILSQKVSCGGGVSWESEQNITDYIDISSLSPRLHGSRLYGFRVNGTSMLGAGIKNGDIVVFDSGTSQPFLDGIYVFSLDGDAYCKRLEFDPIASRIKIYSVRVQDLEKAELLTTLTATDPGYEERFHLFGKVFSVIHLLGEE